jgi:hypothetical protein
VNCLLILDDAVKFVSGNKFACEIPFDQIAAVDYEKYLITLELKTQERKQLDVSVCLIFNFWNNIYVYRLMNLLSLNCMCQDRMMAFSIQRLFVV